MLSTRLALPGHHKATTGKSRKGHVRGNAAGAPLAAVLVDYSPDDHAAKASLIVERHRCRRNAVVEWVCTHERPDAAELLPDVTVNLALA